MSHPSKVKGNTLEREIVDQALAKGLQAARAWGSNGEAMGKHHDVDVLITTQNREWKVQSKRRKAIPKWQIPSEHVDITVIRPDRGKAMVMIDYSAFLNLLLETEL